MARRARKRSRSVRSVYVKPHARGHRGSKPGPQQHVGGYYRSKPSKR